MSVRRFRIGTRNSLLARAQCSEAVALLRAAGGRDAATLEEVAIVSSGDRHRDRPLSEIGGKGAFTRELDAALLSGRIDFAVHSLKDVPGVVEPGLSLASVPPRLDARDALIVGDAARIGRRGVGASLSALRSGSIVGTSSPRRAAILRVLRPDLSIRPMRGNIDTRLAMIASGRFDAGVLAMAGLLRSGREGAASDVFAPETMPPAVGQGALALMTRADDAEALALAARIGCPQAQDRIAEERAFLRALGGDCHTALAGHAEIDGDRVVLRGAVWSEDGTTVRKGKMAGARGGEPGRLGEALARRLLAAMDDPSSFGLSPPPSP